MSLVKRPNSNVWYYLFQIQGRKYFGSTATPKKTLAAKIEAKLRENAISRLVLGEVKPITLEKALERYKRSRKAHRITRTLVLSWSLKPLVQAGVTLAKVSQLLSHSSITTTEIYAHLASNEVSEEAVEVLNRLNRNLRHCSTMVNRPVRTCVPRWCGSWWPKHPRLGYPIRRRTFFLDEKAGPLDVRRQFA